MTKIAKGQRHTKKSALQWMIERFDTDRGRHLYSRRMGTVEPVFGNVCGTVGLDKFSLRGKAKVEAQWQLYCAVHTNGTLARYGRLV